MQANVTQPRGAVVPTLRYRDVATAIDWLCNAFGFDKHLVVSGNDGAVRYAELTFGNGMIMLGPVEDSRPDNFMTQPADTGGAETQICYLFVADAAAHCARAKAAGAEVVFDIEDEHSNGRGYSCRDLEGHVWNFGTYDPWKRQPASAGGSRSANRRGRLRGLTLPVGMTVVAAASALIAGWALGVGDIDDLWLRTVASPGVAEAAAGTPREEPAGEREARGAAERAVKVVREQLAQERAARETAERTSREVQSQLAREQKARETAERRDPASRADAERALEEARQQLVREHGALEDVRRIVQETRERLSLAERAGQAVQEQLGAERSAREAAEAATQQVREQLFKERGAAAERAAKEAREDEARDRAAARRPAPRPRAAMQPSGKSFINWDR
jgi:uncharacterized glyoxalase superfamily protein PhnB